MYHLNHFSVYKFNGIRQFTLMCKAAPHSIFRTVSSSQTEALSLRNPAPGNPPFFLPLDLTTGGSSWKGNAAALAALGLAYCIWHLPSRLIHAAAGVTMPPFMRLRKTVLMDAPHFVYPFVRPWTSGLIPP